MINHTFTASVGRGKASYRIIHYLRGWRKGKHLSRDKVSERMGCCLNTIKRIEQLPDRKISYKMLYGYAKAVGLNLVIKSEIKNRKGN
jgi:transcriptional regulator with XRE-family HTH domain